MYRDGWRKGFRGGCEWVEYNAAVITDKNCTLRINTYDTILFHRNQEGGRFVRSYP